MNELVTLEIPAKAEYVVLGRLALAGLVRERRFSADAVADLKLALTEACTNSIRHAYDHERGQVHLSFEARADVAVTVSNEWIVNSSEPDADKILPPGVSSLRFTWNIDLRTKLIVPPHG